MTNLPMQTWRFSALDTWFFRESRPMESLGGSELLSAFPPSPRTISGVIRSLVGERHEVDWSEWKKSESYPDLKRRIGDANSFGQLKFSGPWLAREMTAANSDNKSTTERLYPVPRNLLAKRDGEAFTELQRATLGAACECDLGNVHMVTLPDRTSGFRIQEDCWLPEQALLAVLAGEICSPDDLVETRELFERESRLGIARNNATRAVEIGLLYQTRHVRPKVGVRLETDVKGLQESDVANDGIVRFGGEGRGAAYAVEPQGEPSLATQKVQVKDDTKGILLLLLTHARITPNQTEEQSFTPLPGFVLDNSGSTTVWTGEIAGIALTLHSSLSGKPVREGGWDLANNKPRKVQSLIPAGSVYYLTVDKGDIQTAINQIHYQQLPADDKDLALGRGLMAVGLWSSTEFPEE